MLESDTREVYFERLDIARFLLLGCITLVKCCWGVIQKFVLLGCKHLMSALNALSA